MIVDHENLGFAVTDANKNLHVLTYSPYAVQSQGGSRLVRRGEIQAGHHIASLKSVQCVLDSQMYAAIGGTAAGTIMVLTPLNEKLFKRLYSLYSRLVTQISHYAGLNPRGCRHLKLDSKILQISSSTSGPPGPRGILDVQLVEVFLSQNARVQHEIASAIGSSVDRILDDILELKRMTEYF